MNNLFTWFLILLVHPFCLLAQQTDTTNHSTDTSIQKTRTDTLDSVRVMQDSSANIKTAQDSSYKSVFKINRQRPGDSLQTVQPIPVQPRKTSNESVLFYLLAALLLMLGIIRTTYSRYFINMFRVFFNSSLRQSQLTDQLVQDKLPSLLLNALFIFTAGFYFYFIIQREGLIADDLNLVFIGSTMAALVLIYVVKFFTLKFIGWITGYHNEADTYIFIIFLINKIIGICLLPVIFILAFADTPLVNIFVIASFIIIGLMLLVRFLRSYGLLQHRLRVSRFHFLLYIFSLEILPLLLIYKAVSLFLTKYL